ASIGKPPRDRPHCPAHMPAPFDYIRCQRRVYRTNRASRKPAKDCDPFHGVFFGTE
ncbi:MAG: hypothetical protein ACI9IV_000493, partial [Paracoccaceae bacterium]